jgi:hypothetical protein
VQIEAGATAVGIGAPGLGSASRADVLVLNGATGDVTAWLQSARPAIIVTGGLFEAPEGVAVVDTRQNSVELVFDGVQWEAKASP